MNERIIDILVNAQRNYNNVSLRKLRAIEEYFKFESINDEDIKRLGEDIVSKIGHVDNEFSVCIRNLNNEEIYEYLSSDKAIRNYNFGVKKAIL